MGPFRIFAPFSAVLGLLVTGCSEDALWGDGPGADAAVTTPSGVQSGAIAISYVLTASSETTTDVAFSYSTNGSVFLPASEGTGGSGTRDLDAGPLGESYVFVWDSGADLDGERLASVVFRVRPDGGTPDVTGNFTVNNGRYLVAVEEREVARVHLLRSDVVDGDLSLVQTLTPGGTDPYDAIFVEGFFVVANRSSNDLTVLGLDEDTERLTAATDSPFSVDGVRPTYLASDGVRVFASNTASDTISILRLDRTTGVLTTTSGSGVTSPGCEGLAVRGSRLYVANEPAGQILVYDIDGDDLLVNGASPITGGGLSTPRALVVAGTRVYAANSASATLCGFNVQGGGGLIPVSGSPFAISGSGIEDLAARGERLVAVTGAAAGLVALTIDPFGAVTEDVESPFALAGAAFGVDAGGDVAIAATSADRIAVFREDGTGALEPGSPSTLDVSVPILRVVLSD